MFQQFTQMFDDFKSYAEKYESEFNSLETKEISKSFRMDLYSQENSYNLYCDLPNIEKDVNISVNKDYILTVSGNRKQDRDGISLVRECAFGPFSRKIKLPLDSQTDKITATYKDGVLQLTIPKKIMEGEITVKMNLS